MQYAFLFQVYKTRSKQFIGIKTRVFAAPAATVIGTRKRHLPGHH